MFNSIYMSESDQDKLSKLAAILTYGNKSKIVRLLINLVWERSSVLGLSDSQEKMLEAMKAGEE